ncbi:MAG: ferritin-like domain-containing protein [Planctomycetota bacterium]|nr:MAG: ferritin-like domain-containing protein [Planctomycetota bacterium]
MNPGPLTEDASIAEFLGRIVASPDLELEWIDLLSQLEYVGCRKIVKSVGFESVNLEILRHVSEEASHAYLLKAVVEEGGLRDRSWRDGRFAEAGWRYFQGLDQRISALPGSEGLRYPGVSWAIERRVLVVYPAYLQVTRNESLKKALRRILAQEERHGAQFGAIAFPDGYLPQVAAIEEALWPDFTAQTARLLSTVKA